MKNHSVDKSIELTINTLLVENNLAVTQKFNFLWILSNKKASTSIMSKSIPKGVPSNFES